MIFLNGFVRDNIYKLLNGMTYMKIGLFHQVLDQKTWNLTKSNYGQTKRISRKWLPGPCFAGKHFLGKWEGECLAWASAGGKDPGGLHGAIWRVWEWEFAGEKSTLDLQKSQSEMVLLEHLQDISCLPSRRLSGYKPI